MAYDPITGQPIAGPPVANLQAPAIPLSSKPDYLAYAVYLEERGWSREQLTIDELNTNIVTLTALAAGTTGIVIAATAAAGEKITMMGTQQVSRGADARTAHSLRIRMAGTNDAEIPLYTKLRITKEKTSEATVQLARMFYVDANLTVQTGTNPRNKTDNENYRWKQGVELNGQQTLRIRAVNTETGNFPITTANTKLAMEMDLWTHEE